MTDFERCIVFKTNDEHEFRRYVWDKLQVDTPPAVTEWDMYEVMFSAEFDLLTNQRRRRTYVMTGRFLKYEWLGDPTRKPEFMLRGMFQ